MTKFLKLFPILFCCSMGVKLETKAAADEERYIAGKHLLGFANEILIEIANNLDLKDLGEVARSCKSLRIIANEGRKDFPYFIEDQEGQPLQLRQYPFRFSYAQIAFFFGVIAPKFVNLSGIRIDSFVDLFPSLGSSLRLLNVEFPKPQEGLPDLTEYIRLREVFKEARNISDSLKELTVKGLTNSATARVLVSQFPNLRFLDLSGEGLDERGYQSIGTLRSLRKLKIGEAQDESGTFLKDEWIEALFPLTNLQSLDSSMNFISHRALDKMTEFPSLRNLSISVSAQDPSQALDISRFSRLIALEELSISPEDGIVGAGEIDLASLANLPKLKRVRIMAFSPRLPSAWKAPLEDLTLSSSFTPEDFEVLSGIETLTTLGLWASPTRSSSEEGIEKLTILENLRSLTLFNFKGEEELAETLRNNFTNLRELKLISTPMSTTYALQLLSELPLQTLLIESFSSVDEITENYIRELFPNLINMDFRTENRKTIIEWGEPTWS